MNKNFEIIISSAKESIAFGNFARAKSLLHRLNMQAPYNSDVLRLLGVIEALDENNSSALDYFDRAIDCDGRNSNAFSNRGNVKKSIGDIQGALNDYSVAIRLDCKNEDAFNGRGLVYELMGHRELALQDYGHAIKISPTNADAYLNQSALLIDMNLLSEAVGILRELVFINPNIPDAWLNMGFALNALKHHEAALDCYDKALALNPNYAKVWNNKGIALGELFFTDQAVHSFKRAIEIDPSSPEPYSNLGYQLHKKKYYRDALDYFDRAISINQTFAEAWSNKGNSLMELKNIDGARHCFISAINSDPAHAEAHNNLGHLLLSSFEFEMAWNEYEWRWKTKGHDSAYFVSNKPRWCGQGNAKSIFVWSEQGIGDQILYSTLLPELSKYAQSITVSTDKKLIPLLQRAYKNIVFIDKKIPLQDEGFDYQVPIASLPEFLRPNLNSFLIAQRVHLRCDETIVQNINYLVSEKVPPTKKRCGLSWFSGNQKLGSDKSIPILELAPILSLGGYEFIDLQYGDTEEGRKAIRDQMGIEMHKFDEINNDDDLEGLLALINVCDVVVTVSNTTAHLAAALGKEILLLLPYSAGKFWYWNNYEGKNLWYENVITFEQEKQGSWEAPVLKIAEYMRRIGGG